MCGLSRKACLSCSDYYDYFNIPPHPSGNVTCIHAGVWHIFSAHYSVGEERPRVYRGSWAFRSDLFSSRFNTIASLRRHPQLIASQNPPVSETAAEVLDEDRLKGGISLAEVSLAWKRPSLCAGGSLVCFGGFPLSCGPRRPEQTLEIHQALVYIVVLFITLRFPIFIFSQIWLDWVFDVYSGSVPPQTVGNSHKILRECWLILVLVSEVDWFGWAIKGPIRMGAVEQCQSHLLF